jgi:hypothetical protein
MIRCEARPCGESGRTTDRAAALHDAWCRRIGVRCGFEQLTPEARAWWLALAHGLSFARAA